MAHPATSTTNGPHKHAHAVYEAARAVLNDKLNPQTKTIKVSIVPSNQARSFVQVAPAPGGLPMMQTTENVENRIVTLVAGRAAEIVLDDGTTPGGPDSSFEYALHLAEQHADNTVINWRKKAPNYAYDMVERCLERAKTLVKENEQQIRKVSAALQEKGTLTDADLASI